MTRLNNGNNVIFYRPILSMNTSNFGIIYPAPPHEKDMKEG